MNLARLRRDLEATLLARSSFARLRCRGFSYRYSSRPTGFPAQLRSAIDVRAAIFADTRSHYPPRVLAYLTRMSSSHYYDYHGPAIAFAFGMLRNRRLYIVTLQSDLVYNTPSAVRDHFRGWRRILLSLLASQIRPREVLLIRSDDVLRACYNAANVPRKVPLSWRNIYEQTAREAGGRQIELARGLNVQLYAHHPKVIARSFYVL